MSDFFNTLFATGELATLVSVDALLYFVATIALIAMAKFSYDRSVSYSLVTELADKDNHAASISFSGFLFGFGIILWGVLDGGQRQASLWGDLADLAVVGVCGMILLSLGQRVADLVILPRWNIREEITKRNLAAGIAEGASYVGTGLIVMASVKSGPDLLGERLLSAVIFFVAGQIAFILFSAVYQRVTPFDVAKDIQEGNSAAALGLGGNLIAIAILLAHTIKSSASLVTFGVWFVGATALLIVFRWVVDHIILSGHALNEEISRDKNWGVALLEASSTIVIALILTSAF